MRVTHIITRLVVGGAQENTVATVFGLRETKPDVEVSLISGPTTGPEGSLESRFTPYPGLLTIVPALVRPVHIKDPLALRHLTRLLRQQQPDIVHTHSGKAGVLGRIAARRARVPVVLHHIHGPSFGPFQGWLPNLVFTAAERYAGKLTDHFLCSAEAMSKRYLEAGIGNPAMYTRVFSGFSVEQFVNSANDQALRTQLGFSADDFVIGKVARLFPLKGHEDLLRATVALIQEVPRARLLFIGDGPLRRQMETEVKELGLQNHVVFTGLLAPTEVPRYLGIVDCLAHLSTREALSRALPQALAAGKPVVSYDFDGADEVCLEGRTGFLVRSGDIEGVTSALRKLALSPRLRAELGHYGQQFVRQRFEVRNMVEEIYQLYLRLWQNHLRRSAGAV